MFYKLCPWILDEVALCIRNVVNLFFMRVGENSSSLLGRLLMCGLELILKGSLGDSVILNMNLKQLRKRLVFSDPAF